MAKHLTTISAEEIKNFLPNQSRLKVSAAQVTQIEAALGIKFTRYDVADLPNPIESVGVTETAETEKVKIPKEEKAAPTPEKELDEKPILEEIDEAAAIEVDEEMQELQNSGLNPLLDDGDEEETESLLDSRKDMIKKIVENKKDEEELTTDEKFDQVEQAQVKAGWSDWDNRYQTEEN